ncbi:unnamed protein product, partial [Brenthis ino]
MTSEKGSRKDKNQNIQVFVRLRPLNQRERDIKSLGVVEVVNGREVVVRQSQQSMHTKRFTFDRAFPPHSKQVEVYQEVVSPLIEEVLAGYNCTVFAYGQTGTGKTHTMVGEAANNETTWQSDPLAGIIPRALSQLFDELRISNTEYTVRVSYLELYNEELFDLLSASEDNSKLRIYEDVTRKGANIVNGLEEITVYNKNEVYKIMAQGQERKRVASTLMNAQSSRSHTVFTIVVHMKENSPEGEELVKIGKLNLVDLAGSENISKAGSDNPAKRERARECVNINQSLLTLGRVITALVERHPHIPYRESKLTRILQESLGGRTKTSIIATISPGHKDLEETMSTLEYANRAKNIQNKPEVNQKMTKKAILKDYAEEIDRLKRDLHAAREKNGVYLANETFTEMTLKQEEQRKEIQELLLKKRAMEEEKEKMENVFRELHCQLELKEQYLERTEQKLQNTKTALVNTSNMLKTTKLQYEEQKHLVSAQAQTESALSAQAQALLRAADAAAADACKLLHTVDKRKSVESTNLEITRTYREVSSQHRNHLTSGTDNFVSALTQTLSDFQTTLESYTNDSTQMHAQNKQKLDSLVQQAMDTMNKVTAIKNAMQQEIAETSQTHCTQFVQTIQAKSEQIQNILEKFAMCLVTCLQKAGEADFSSNIMNFVNNWRTATTSNLSKLHNSHATLESRARALAAALLGEGERQNKRRRDAAHTLAQDVQNKIDAILEEKDRTEKQISQQLSGIQNEKEEFEARLNKWADEERKLLEERIKNHIASEKNFLESKMKKKLEDLENQRNTFENKLIKDVEWLKNVLKLNEIEGESATRDLETIQNELDICMCDLNNFAQDYEKSRVVLSSNMDSLSDGTVQVVEQVKVDLLNDLAHTQTYVQTESNALLEENKQTMSLLAEDSTRLVEAIVQNCQRTMDTVVGEVHVTSTSAIQELSSLSTITSNLSSETQGYSNSQKHTLNTMQRQTEQFYNGIREEVFRLEELESRCLNQEYAVYCPSGSTPVRAEYRYPRQLAATSPHERVLARFRAMRQNSHDDDCIVIETEGEVRSDTESSASDDSAFAAPSPPAPPAPTHDWKNHIVKCTSETDLYLKRRQQEQQGKENVNRSMSFKKPSKLPAPASHKKPLIERNDN